MVWNKYLSVEIPLLCGTFSLILQMAVSSNLIIYRMCYVVLGYNESDCAQLGREVNNITTNLEPKVQPTYNQYNMVQIVIHTIIPLVFCMYVGTWSDRFGRKPFLLICLFGLLLSGGISSLIVYFPYLSPWWFILSSLPLAVTGGYTALFITITAYLTDVSTEKDRVIRLGLFEVIFAAVSLVCNLLAVRLLYATGYETVYLLSTALIAIALVYTFFFIPESLKSEKKQFTFSELLNAINFIDIVKDVIKKRENNARPYIFAILGAQIVHSLSSGEMVVSSLFLRAKLHWTLTQITTVGAFVNVGNISGTLFSTYVLYKVLKLKEFPLCIFGLILLVGRSILFGLATNNYYIYAGQVLGIFYGLPGLMLRTVLSYLVVPEDMGKIFAISNIIISLQNMIAGVIFPLIYNATLNINPGIYNFLNTGIFVTTAVLVVLMIPFKFPYLKTLKEGEAEGPPELNFTVNNIEVLGIDERRSSKKISLEIFETKRLSQNPGVF